VVLWLDSGLAVHKSLRAMVAAARATGGFSSDVTAKSIARFSHPTTLEYFVRHFQFDRSLADALIAKRRQPDVDSLADLPEAFARKFRNCNGAFSAHVPGTPRFEAISKRWLQCSLVRDCVCPVGSNRANHRQDQAALTLLAVMDDYQCGGPEHHDKAVQAHGLKDYKDVLNDHGLDTAKGKTFC